MRASFRRPPTEAGSVLERAVRLLSGSAGLTWLRRVAIIAILLGLFGFVLNGANLPARPYLSQTRLAPQPAPLSARG